MTHNATAAIVIRSAAVAAVAMLVGCASQKGGSRSGVVDPKPPEQQSLADLQPPITLPKPATRPADPASGEALEAYALGRDALLRNQKPTAIKFFEQACELGAESALVWRDLGYAQVGRDDTKAAVAFRHAVGLDPDDADSRLQLARLLLAGDKNDAAVEQLRFARLSSDYADSPGLAAVVDLLLGQSLEQAHYRTAALECYESVLRIVDDEGVDLRGRPELADVLQRPGVLVLRVADLATECGQYARANELYRRLQAQEPQTAAMIELRLARTELAAGDRTSGTQRAFNFVKSAGGSTLSVALFDELFEPYGGADGAIKSLAAIDAGSSLDAMALLKSHLYLEKGDATEAVRAIDEAGRVKAADAAKTGSQDAFALPIVRQTVHAYRAAGLSNQPGGRSDALLVSLLQHTKARPADWATWSRGWTIMTQPAQADPLTADRLLSLPLNGDAADLGPTRDFVASTIYAQQGRLRTAQQFEERAASGPNKFDVAKAKASASGDVPEVDIDTPKEFAVLVDAYRDDPELLATVTAATLRSDGKNAVLGGYAAANAANPGDVVIATTYAQILSGVGRQNEGANVIDKAAGLVKSANALYALASQYSAMGDEKSAERLLRQAHDQDPSLASVCNDLGYLLTDKGRELSFAEQLLTRAAEAEPDNAAYLDSLGWLLYKRGKFDAAAARLEEAVKASDPVDPVVLDHAGDALYRLNKHNESSERWEQAVQAIKDRGTNDPQLRLRVEQKLRQLKDKSPVVVAPVANGVEIEAR